VVMCCRLTESAPSVAHTILRVIYNHIDMQNREQHTHFY
jgi:hypothetical protein